MLFCNVLRAASCPRTCVLCLNSSGTRHFNKASRGSHCSESVTHSLLREHDSDELIKGDLLVAIEVGYGDHLADVLLGELAFEHLGDFSEFARAEHLLARRVEDEKGLEQFVLRLRVLQLRRH